MPLSTLSARTGLAVLLTALAFGASAKPGPKSEVVQADWLTRPGSSQFADAHSPRCQLTRVAIPGKALVECDLARDGRLQNCVLLSEEPWDCEYGRTALEVMPGFRAKPRLKDGRPLAPGMKVRVPMRFE